ncbi:unnamed protein product [Larinioides sclopetarius]|uniref:Uncharacterized protein n=1 Tax=Larinioides sclopetarius TaxID=280406 RepID=A0AAV2BBE0_9ARAC
MEIKLIRNANGAHTWNEEELAVYCREFVDNVDCKQEYLKKCDNETAGYLFVQIIQDFRDLAQEICNETSDLRAAFRSHNVCIRNASDEYGDCFRSSFHQSAREVYGNPSNSTNVEKKVRIFCRLQEVYTECVSSAVKKSCGQDAATFAGTILTRPFTRLRSPFCVEGRGNDYMALLEKRLEDSKKRNAAAAATESV